MRFEIIQGNNLDNFWWFDDSTFQCCITSPPYYGLRDYEVKGQIGLEETPEAYVYNLVQVFREIKRVLKDDGTLWLNLGDSYNAYNGNRGKSKGINKNNMDIMPRLPSGSGLSVKTLKQKDLIGIPWRVAFALQQDGWYLRQDIIWHKPNPMPESVRDRCTKAHEYIFLFSKSPKYYFDSDAILEPFSGIREGKTGKRSATPFTAAKADRSNSGGFSRSRSGRNKRSVWSVTTKSFKGAHFAAFPLDLIEPCVLAGSAAGDRILDPFSGAGTTGVVALKHGRKYVGLELNPEYCKMSRKRIGAL